MCGARTLENTGCALGQVLCFHSHRCAERNRNTLGCRVDTRDDACPRHIGRVSLVVALAQDARNTMRILPASRPRVERQTAAVARTPDAEMSLAAAGTS